MSEQYKLMLAFLFWSGIEDTLGFYPMGILSRVMEITIDQINMVVDYVSDVLFDEDGTNSLLLPWHLAVNDCK